MQPLQPQMQVTAPVTDTDTGVKATFTFPEGARILKVGYIVGTTSTAALAVDFETRATVSASGVKIADVDKPASDQQDERFVEEVDVLIPAGGELDADYATNTANQGARIFVIYTMDFETEANRA